MDVYIFSLYTLYILHVSQASPHKVISVGKLEPKFCSHKSSQTLFYNYVFNSCYMNTTVINAIPVFWISMFCWKLANEVTNYNHMTTVHYNGCKWDLVAKYLNCNHQTSVWGPDIFQHHNFKWWRFSVLLYVHWKVLDISEEPWSC